MCYRFPRQFDVVVNTKFPRATYHTMVPSTEELCCLNRKRFSHLAPPFSVETGCTSNVHDKMMILVVQR